MAMSCAPPALLGLYRYKRMEPPFHPFILTLVLSLFTEVATKIMKERESYSLYFPLANFYLLVNVLLFYLFFRELRVITTRYKNAFIIGFILLTVIGCFINSPAKSFPYFTSISFYIYILAASVKMLSMQVFETRVSIFSNPLFYIAAGSIIFHTMSIFTTLLSLSISSKANLNWYFFAAEKIVNPLHYFLFLLAILWIPKRKLQYG